jgi:phosphate-selective porin OprO/OprP
MLMGFGANAMADSTTDIVNALVAKGVLTEEEGDLLTKGRTGETEAAEAKKKTAVSGKVKDGITWESGDGKNSIAVQGRVQLDYRQFDNDRDAATTEGFDVRRAYFGVAGKIGEFYDYKVVGNLAEADKTTTSKSNQLDEAYFGINWWKEASFRFGQFKMPFSLEEQTSSRFIDFQERSLANKMVPAKEIGAMIHGDINGVFYGAALSTGESRSNVEGLANEGNDVIVRVGTNLAKYLDQKNNVYHLAVAGSWGDQGTAMNIEANNEGKGGTIFKSSSIIGKRDRMGLEGAVALGPVKFQSEYIRNSYDVTSYNAVDKNGTGVDADAWYVSALWMITGENYADSYKAGKFDRLKPINNFNPENVKSGMGAWEVGVRYSSFDASDLTKVGVSGTTTNLKSDAVTAGLKWIVTPNTRIMLNYVDTNFDKPIGNINGEKAVTLRTQMDF